MPEQRFCQLAGRLASERCERKLLIAGTLHPLGTVLRAEVHEHQGARAGGCLDELGDECVGARIDPVQIVDQEDRRLALAARVRQVVQDAEEAALACLTGVAPKPAKRAGSARLGIYT